MYHEAIDRSTLEYDLDAPVRHPYHWGDASTHPVLPEPALQALRALGATPAPEPAAIAEIRVAPSALPADAAGELVGVVGAEQLSSEDEARVRHTRGASMSDVLALRAGDGSAAPDAVLTPACHEQVLAVLQICSRHAIAVVPYGGGTSVVGGLEASPDGFAAVVALDLRRLDALHSLDETSRVAVLGAGMRAVVAERLLGERGYTLGHFPQSYEMATIGGYAATRSAGQASAGYGRFDELVVGLTAATPAGTISLTTAPMSADGPDLRQLLLGCEGAFGVITSVAVRVRPAPEARVYEGWRLPSFAAGSEALRALAQEGPLPTVVRLSDEVETGINLAEPDAAFATADGGGCLLIVGYEGTERRVAATRSLATERLQAAGAVRSDPAAGDRWRAGRFRGPYLREPALAAGALLETIETATFWSGLAALRASVTEALTQGLAEQGARGVVMCHLSHVYETGASLYFTVIAGALADPIAQWTELKHAANQAILAGGGAVSHHHGVGRDHREPLAQLLGPVAIEALRAVKRSLDPAGILNPGVLIDSDQPL